MKKIINYIKALFKHTKNRFKKVSMAEYSRRYNICMECPLMELKDVEECTECGCPIYKKVEWQSERCPQKKW